MFNDDFNDLPVLPVLLPIAPFPKFLGKIFLWLSIIPLVYSIIRSIAKIPLPAWLTVISGMGFIIGILLMKGFNGTIIFNPKTRKILLETTAFGKPSSLIINDFSQIHAIALENKTEFSTPSSGMQKFDDTLSSTSRYRVVAVTSSGKIVYLSDFIKEGSGNLYKLATEAGRLVGCPVVEGAPCTKLRVERHANGRFHLATEFFDPIERMRKFFFAGITILAIIVLITMLI